MSKGTVKAVSWLVLLSSIGAGGYLDMQNNGQEKASTEGSNPTLVAEYQEQIGDLLTLKQSGEDITAPSIDFLTSVYVNTQISESNVETLTDQFATKIAPPATLPGGYVLEHPEFLDEARSETPSRNLGALDQATMAKHQESMNDGPWLGMLGGWAAYELGVLSLVLLAVLGKGGAALAGSAGDALARRRRSKPASKYGNH